MSEVIEDIHEYIREFKNMPEQGANINRLIYIRTKLSVLSVFFAEEVAEAKEAYLDAKTLYETEKLNIRMANLQKGVGVAQTISRQKTAEEHSLQNRAEGINNRMYLILRQLNEVLGALNQRISFSKEEWKRDNSNG